MGSTNKTTNYELSQFVGADKPSWLGDYNADMSKIDLAIKARAVEAGQAQDSANTANDKADALDTRMDTAEDNILALQNASTADHTQIATNTANISKNAQDIVQLDAKIGHTQITIGDHTVTGAIATLAGQGGVEADNVSYDNTQSGLTATNVQAAIDEVADEIPDDASEVAYSNTQSGLSATTVQGAIDELAQGGGLRVVAQATADGVKSTATLLEELHTQLADVTLNPDAVLVIDTSSGIVVFQLSNTASELGFTSIKCTSSDFFIDYAKIASTGAFYESTKEGMTDYSSLVRSSGDKFIVYN